MKTRRVLGFIFLVAAAAGFFFCIIALVAVWTYRPKIIQSASDNLSRIDLVLTTTQDGLAIIGQEVHLIAVNITSLQTTTQALGGSIHDSNPILNSLADLTNRDLPGAITATQTSLNSAQSSAQLIDSVLSGLTNIPFLPIPPYRPEVPLHTALAQVSTSLNTLKPSLATINASLLIGKNNMSVLETELSKITDTSKEMSTTFAGIQTIVDQYKTVTTQLQGQVQSLQVSFSGWITGLSLILSFILIWLFIAQFSLAMQGLTLLEIPLPVE